MAELEFEAFPKIARLNREIVISEKIDGTNAQILIEDIDGKVNMRVGSRNKWLSMDSDNAGFFRWVIEHADEVVKLGYGRHYGEWWGSGIQRGYGLKEKRFSLFNTARWNKDNLPPCVGVVPLIYSGPFSEDAIKKSLDILREQGSLAAPGFMKPEGVVVFHTAASQLFKVTLENDEKPKGMVGNG